MQKSTLKNLRKGLGLSMNDVHEKAGISLVQLSKYELGQLWPTDEHLHRLAEIYEVDADDLKATLGLPNRQEPKARRLGRGPQGRNPWTSDEESLLFEIVLDALREGNSHHQALKQASKQLGRSVDACAGYLNNFIRPFYGVEIEQAKQAGRVKRTHRKVLSQIDATENLRNDGERTAGPTAFAISSELQNTVSATELVMRLLELASGIDDVREPLVDSRTTRQLTNSLRQISSMILDIIGMRDIPNKEFAAKYDDVLLAFLGGELTESQATLEYFSWPAKYEEWKAKQ